MDGEYLENGTASSRANAYAMRVSANMAEQPVKNCTRIANPHITVPPVWPPAFRKICAAGRPVGVCRMASRSVMQKQRQIVRSQPMRPETMTADWMAKGPRAAASWVSSDMLFHVSALVDRGAVINEESRLSGAIVVGHGPCDGDKP